MSRYLEPQVIPWLAGAVGLLVLGIVIARSAIRDAKHARPLLEGLLDLLSDD